MYTYQYIYDSFLQNSSHPIAIWGAGKIGTTCYNFLQSIKKDKEVIFFVDSSPEKQGRTFLNKTVYDPSHLLSRKEINVIIAALPCTEICKIMKEQKINNKKYYALNFPNPYDKYLTYSEKQVINEYDTSDLYTKKFLECYFFSKNHNDIIIFSEENINSFQKNLICPDSPYWIEGSGVDLNIFDSITFIDAGAYTGDTIIDLNNRYGERLSNIFAFEPDPRNFERLNHLCQNQPLNFHVTLFQSGLSDKNQKVFLSNSGTLSGKIEKTGRVTTKTTTLDETDITVSGKLCIKMDIEGSELAALKGAKETIKKYKPELAICIYHQAADIYEIPNYIHSLVPEYRCVIRGGTHTVCYASVER